MPTLPKRPQTHNTCLFRNVVKPPLNILLILIISIKIFHTETPYYLPTELPPQLLGLILLNLLLIELLLNHALDTTLPP